MKKITIELSDDDVEEGMSLLHRAAEIVDRLETIAEDLQEFKYMVQELKELQNANKTKRSRPPVFNRG